MFGRTAAAVILAVFAGLSGGCGTLINQSNEPGQAFYSDQLPAQMPFGGVARDLAAPPAGVWHAVTAEPDPGVLARTQMITAAVLVPPLDLPFSLIGDTLTLPFDLAHTFGWSGTAPANQNAAQPPPPAATRPADQTAQR
jgi:uncharacterized protein YceK